uniref:Uncharacterized protein n=1 Tax=Moniliophthora roreri TaxID=221103 RepID=A0A0W0G9Q6_MONRR
MTISSPWIRKPSTSGGRRRRGRKRDALVAIPFSSSTDTFTATGNLVFLYSFIGTPPESSCQAIQTVRILIIVLAQILIEILIGLAAFSIFYQEGKFSGREKAGAWVVEFAYDTLIFLLALRKVFRARRALEIPLLSVLIRDGAAYFGAMSLANLATAPRPVQSERRDSSMPN